VDVGRQEDLLFGVEIKQLTTIRDLLGTVAESTSSNEVGVDIWTHARGAAREQGDPCQGARVAAGGRARMCATKGVESHVQGTDIGVADDR
jgi:hypothetical protein